MQEKVGGGQFGDVYRGSLVRLFFSSADEN
jgi:hypothetical protein